MIGRVTKLQHFKEMHLQASLYNVKLTGLTCYYWREILIVLMLATVAGAASYLGARLIDPIIYQEALTDDVWFQSDIGRVFENMTARGSDHYRTSVHPLFSLAAFPPTHLLRRALGLDPTMSVKLIIALVAALWISILFILLRLIGCRPFDAVLFSLLGATSASAMFWFVVPETYSFGSLGILLALCIVALGHYRPLSPIWYMFASILTFSFTITNWMVGILATFVNYPWKRALQITVNSFCVVILLWGVEKFFFPSAQFFIGDREEVEYTLVPESGGPLRVVSSFIFHAIVLPTINFSNRFGDELLIMDVQHSLPGSGSLWGTIAVGLWAVLLGLGLWTVVSTKQHLPLRLVVGLTLLGQLMLHLIYGEETFLYALHFGPLLIVVTAFSTLTRTRPIALILAGALLLTMALNNGLQFNTASSYIHSLNHLSN